MGSMPASPSSTGFFGPVLSGLLLADLLHCPQHYDIVYPFFAFVSSLIIPIHRPKDQQCLLFPLIGHTAFLPEEL